MKFTVNYQKVVSQSIFLSTLLVKNLAYKMESFYVFGSLSACNIYAMYKARIGSKNPIQKIAWFFITLNLSSSVVGTTNGSALREF